MRSTEEMCDLLAGMSQVSDNYREGRRLQSHGVQTMQIRLLLDLPHCVGATRLILVRVPQQHVISSCLFT